MTKTQEHLKQMGFRLNKDVTKEERKKRKEEWKNLQIIRQKPHRG